MMTAHEKIAYRRSLADLSLSALSRERVRLVGASNAVTKAGLKVTRRILAPAGASDDDIAADIRQSRDEVDAIAEKLFIVFEEIERR